MKKVTKKMIGVLAAFALTFAGCTTEVDTTPVENTENPGGSGDSGNTPGESPVDKPTIGDVSNKVVNIVKSEGVFNSAYIIFEQIEGATYEVYCDDVKIDEPLIRFYDNYVYNTYDEATSKWTEGRYSKVVRADALGLKAGSHTMKVCAVGTENKSEFSSSTMIVSNYDRQGFAFTGIQTPGAYNADGTLKDGAVVIYVTDENKKSVTATIGSQSYVGVAAITQAIKSKNTGTTPIDIRIVGQITGYADIACSDMRSAYALGVKGANYVTIEGVGDDATLFGAGVAAFASEYIEISNLGLVKWGGGKDGDGISLKGSKYVWVHNNDYFYGNAGSDGDQVKGDGSMDMKDDSQYVTVSYNHFWDSGKMSLCGMKSESGPNYITYHHNWFDHSDSRHPRVRRMSVHVYNNYFDGNSKYGIGVTSGGNIFAEGNYFRNAHNPMMISMQGTDAQGAGTFSGETGGQIKSFNNKYVENNTNGVKFQFITNKYDYTNNQPLDDYKEWTETVGTQNSDGTWTIYESKVTTEEDQIASNSLIRIVEASKKGEYYQGSGGKTLMSLSVPKNTTKIIVEAKTGSSTAGASTTLTVNGEKSDTIANTDYSLFEFAISGFTTDSEISLKNSGSNSLNVKSVKVIASSGWETVLSSGVNMSDIDAFEVDTRSEKIPDSVKSKSGNHVYSNFDTVMGDSELGLTSVPTNPDVAKSDVVKYAGRHNPDLVWNFDNTVDDVSYAVDAALNTKLEAYKTNVTAIFGDSSSGSTDSGSGDSGSGDSGNTGESGGGSGDVTTVVTGSVFTLTGTGDFACDWGTVSVTGNMKSNVVAKEYGGQTFTTALKMESSTSIKINLPEAKKLTFITDATAAKKIKIDGTNNSTDASGNLVSVSLTAGEHTILKGDSLNLYAIIAE